MVRSLPLRNGFFATPQISPSEENELLSWGRSLVADLHYAEADWTIVQEKKGVTVWEDRQKGGMTYSVRAVATVTATLDDIMELFMARTTPEFRGLLQIQCRDHFADAAVLFHKEQDDMESLGVKWMAMRSKKSPMAPMAATQDFCVLEYAGVVGMDVIGGHPDKPLGVCLYESIEQLECPSLYDSHRLERGSISKCGYLFRPREDANGGATGVVEAQFVCSIRQPPNQRARRRVNRSLLLNWAESVGVIAESLSRRRISRELTLRREPTWVSDKDRHCCHLCMKTFTNTRRKHHCRVCGEVICRNCSMYKSVELQSVGLTTLRVCKSCMDGTNAKPEAAAPMGAAVPGGGAPGFTAPVNSMASSADEITLPRGISNDQLSVAVEEFALALPSQQVSTVPDLVGLAWLQQVAARDPSKRDVVSELMERLRLEEQARNADADKNGEQVDIYDTLCDLAAQTLACKYAVVSLIDENRQWFKSAVNVRESDVPRDFSFCEYPVREQRPLVVMDALRDPRFQDNPFVTGPLAVRFLAGAPLFTVDNECVGAVCVLDTEPRTTLQDNQIATMQNLAHLAMVMVQERREAQNRLNKSLQIVTTMGGGGRPQLQQGSDYDYRPYQPAQQHQLYASQPVQSGAAPVGGSSDLVPLSSYTGEMVVQTKKPEEDPALKEQMIKLLQKASQVHDQVNLQSQTNAQHAGLQSSAE